MKVHHIGLALEPKTGGTYRSVSNFAGALMASGADVTIWSFSPCRQEESSDAVHHIPVRTPFLGRKYFWWPGIYHGGLSRMLDGADLIFLHGLFAHPLAHAAEWAYERGIPYIVIPHGCLDPYVFSYRKWRKRLWMLRYGDLLLRRSARLIFATSAEQSKAAPWGLGASEVINWPVAPVADFDKAAVAHRIRVRHGLPENTRLALVCGRMHPSKRIAETVRGFTAAGQDSWVLLVVGPPTDVLPASSMHKLCGTTNGKAIYAGPAYGDELADYYRAADVFLSFSWKENFGYTVAEALAAGTPVSISTGVDLASHIAEAGCGLVSSITSQEDITSAISRTLAQAPEMLAALGRRGRAWTRQNLSPGRFSHRLLSVCGDVLSRHRERQARPAA